MSKHTSKRDVIDYIFENYKEELSNTKLHFVFERAELGRYKKHFDKYNDLSRELKRYESISDFIKTNIYEKIKNKLKDIFFPKEYSQVFVNPIVESDVKDEDVREIEKYIIDKWIMRQNDPLLVITGEGGVGKTTLVKRISSQVDKDVLFIDVGKYLQESVVFNGEDDLFEIVKNYISKQMSDENYDKNLLNLLLNSGGILLVIDGVDEFILRSDSFDLEKFLKFIMENSADNIGSMKIIMTLRDSIMKLIDSSDKIFPSFKILGFDDDIVEQFLQKKGLRYEKIKKVKNFLKDLFVDNEYFSPFIVDISADLYKDINSDYILPDTNFKLLSRDVPWDMILLFSLYREENRYGIKVEEQIDFIKKLIIDYNFIMNREHLKSEGYKIEAYVSHPLFIFDKESLKFKYEIIEKYFVVLLLYEMIKNEYTFENSVFFNKKLLGNTDKLFFNNIVENKFRNLKDEIKFF